MVKVVFADLSWPLRVAIVASWLVGGLFCFTFLVGFIGGVLL